MRRYENRSTLMTSNRPVEEWGKLVGDVGAYLEKRMSGEEASAFRKNYEVTPEGKPMNDTELGQLYNAMDKARAEWAALDQKIKAND